jgi:hypothetical protein
MHPADVEWGGSSHRGGLEEPKMKALVASRCHYSTIRQPHKGELVWGRVVRWAKQPSRMDFVLEATRNRQWSRPRERYVSGFHLAIP